MGGDDKVPTAPGESRFQPRIRTQVEVRVSNPEGTGARRASLENLSWGGALIRCEKPPGAAGDTVELQLPYRHGKPITVSCEVLRVESGDDKGPLVALRFFSLSPEHETRLDNLLEMLLSGPGGGRRRHPRLAQRLEVYFDDPVDVRATLEDISQGGLAVTVPYSFGINQSVELTIYGGGAIGELSFRARVVHAERLNDTKTELFRVGLKIEHPLKDLQDLTHRLLEKMASKEAQASRKWLGK